MKNILFDLDGTLLPMDMDKFTHAYFKRLAVKTAPLGYEPEPLIKAVWAGTAAMVKNNGETTNYEAFWKRFGEIFPGSEKDRPVFDEFYANEFQQVKSDCGFNPDAAKTVAKLKEKGYRLVLATNPIFPSVATKSRIRWAGLDPNDFEYFSTYENSHYCKPNPMYFSELAQKLSLAPEECLMVGNDGDEDTPAAKTGMSVFLITDCLLNRSNRDLSAFPQGGFDDLLKYVDSL